MVKGNQTCSVGSNQPYPFPWRIEPPQHVGRSGRALCGPPPCWSVSTNVKINPPSPAQILINRSKQQIGGKKSKEKTRKYTQHIHTHAHTHAHTQTRKKTSMWARDTFKRVCSVLLALLFIRLSLRVIMCECVNE